MVSKRSRNRKSTSATAVAAKHRIPKPDLLVDSKVHRIGVGALSYGIVSRTVKKRFDANFDRLQAANWHDELSKQGAIDTITLQIPHRLAQRDRRKLSEAPGFEATQNGGSKRSFHWLTERWTCSRTGLRIATGTGRGGPYTKIEFSVPRLLGLDNTFHTMVRLGWLRFALSQAMSFVWYTNFQSRKHAREKWGDAELGSAAIIKLAVTTNFFANVAELVEDFRGRKLDGVRRQAQLDDYGNGASVRFSGTLESLQAYDKGAEQEARKKKAIAAKKRRKKKGQPFAGQPPASIPTVERNALGRVELVLEGRKLKELAVLAGAAADSEHSWRLRVGTKNGCPQVLRVRQSYPALHTLLFRRIERMYPAKASGAQLKSVYDAGIRYFAEYPAAFEQFERSKGSGSSTVRRARKQVDALRASQPKVRLLDLCYSREQQDAMRAFMESVRSRAG